MQPPDNRCMHEDEAIGDCREKRKGDLGSELKGTQPLPTKIWIQTSKLNFNNLWLNTLSHSLRFSWKKFQRYICQNKKNTLPLKNLKVKYIYSSCEKFEFLYYF